MAGALYFSGMAWVHRLSDINTETLQGMCAACGWVDLRMRKPRRDGTSAKFVCRIADALHNKRRFLNGQMSEKDFRKLFEAQGSICAICGSDSGTFGVDHCHNTGAVRGILCRQCNAGLGMFRDSPDRLRRAIEYLT